MFSLGAIGKKSSESRPGGMFYNRRAAPEETRNNLLSAPNPASKVAQTLIMPRNSSLPSSIIRKFRAEGVTSFEKDRNVISRPHSIRAAEGPIRNLNRNLDRQPLYPRS